MATVTPSQDELALRATLMLNVQIIIDTKIDDLIQTTKFGEMFSFRAGRPLFERAIALFRSLASANLELISETKLKQLIDMSNQVVNQFNQFKSFQPIANNVQFPTQGRDALLNAFKTLYDQTFGVISSVLALSQPQNLAQYESEARALAEKMNMFFAEQQKQFLDYKMAAEKEIGDTLVKAKQAAQEVGIVQHETFFRSEANGHKKMATIWLVATSLLAVATGLVGWFNYSRTLAVLQSAISATPTATALGNTGITIQLTIAKLIMFSILFSAVLWAGRIYRAHRHNYVINKHRQNALSTFEAFVKATEDTPTKNAVLLQATQCIFGPQTTGYLPQEKEAEAPTQIFEFIRGATSAKS
jgi:hypothetical protein